jgi:hypothetical protein
MARYTKEGYGGVSSQTKKGLLDSGAMDKSDFGISTPTPSVKSIIPRDPTRQIPQKQADQMIRRQTKERDDAWLRSKDPKAADAMKQRDYSRNINNLGKYAHKPAKRGR